MTQTIRRDYDNYSRFEQKEIVSMTKFFIADDHQLFIDGLICLVEGMTGYSCCGSSLSGNELIRKLGGVVPDLLLLDLNMPDGDGMSVIPDVKKMYPEMKILVITSYKNQGLMTDAYKKGIDGMFFKQGSSAELRDAIAEVMTGEVYMPQGRSVFPKKKVVVPTVNPKFGDKYMLVKSLTPRELEVLNLLSDAKGVKDIAGELYISQETVAVHKKNIMKKLQVNNVAGMVKFAIEQDLGSDILF